MAAVRVYTTPTCSYCKLAKDWLNERGCEYEELDITSDVKLLREWRSLSGGAGVPVLAHGTDFVIGFQPERYEALLDSCDHCSPVDADALEQELES